MSYTPTLIIDKDDRDKAHKQIAARYADLYLILVLKKQKKLTNKQKKEYEAYETLYHCMSLIPAIFKGHKIIIITPESGGHNSYIPKILDKLKIAYATW